MIKRELYMSRIRPFIGTELVKVMTGIRRCGKSVMLELIQQELAESGVSRAQFISINFEDMSYSHLQTAQALQSSWSYIAQLRPMRPSNSVFKSTCLPEGCPTSQTSAMRMRRPSNIFTICSTLSSLRTS